MTRLAFTLALTLVAILLPTHATPATTTHHSLLGTQQKATPPCGNTDVSVDCYQVGTVPALNCPANLECEITLVKNETISSDNNVHTGDQDSHWRIGWEQSTDRDGATYEHVHVLYVEPASTPVPNYVLQPGTAPPPTPAPTPDGRFTNLTIATDHHEYRIYLHSVQAVYTLAKHTAIAFYDPVDLRPTPAPFVPPLPTPTPDPLRTELAQADCSQAHVRITGRAPFMPQQVCIGHYHYFIRVSPDAPGATITGYDVKGNERQVNWAYYDDGYYVVPAPEKRLALLSGDGRTREEIWIEFR